MALKATVFRVALDVADITREHYARHDLTVARHPSETDERMMYRVIAFALHAREDLQLTRGLSTSDEPDLWQRDATGEVLLWVELGQPDERRIRRACGLAHQVAVYVYDERAGRQWRARREASWRRFTNLSITFLKPLAGGHPAGLVARSMSLGATIQEDRIWLSDPRQTVEVERRPWLAPP